MPSMRYESMEEGGRTPAGVYRFTEAQFAQYQFPSGGRAFCFVSKLIGEDGVNHEQAYLAGNVDDFSPDKDGQSWKPLGQRVAFRKDSGFGQLAKSHAEAGFPYPADEAEDTTGNLFENLVAYMDWIDDAGRRYRCKAEGCGIYFDTPEQCMAHQKGTHQDDTPVRKGQNFLIQSIVSLPSEWSGTMPGSSAASTPGAPAATAAVRRRPGTGALPATQSVQASDNGHSEAGNGANGADHTYSPEDLASLRMVIMAEVPEGGNLPIASLRAIVMDPNKSYRATDGPRLMAMLTKPAVLAEAASGSDGVLVLEGNAFKLAN